MKTIGVICGVTTDISGINATKTTTHCTVILTVHCVIVELSTHLLLFTTCVQLISVGILTDGTQSQLVASHTSVALVSLIKSADLGNHRLCLCAECNVSLTSSLLYPIMSHPWDLPLMS